MRQPPAWAGTYVGIPYRDLGRDRSGLDCWGLVRLVLAERAGVALPSYGISEADTAAVGSEVVAAKASGRWLRVEQPQAIDVAVLTMPVHTRDGWLFEAVHVGVIVAPGWLLHTERATGAVLVRTDDLSIARRIESIWRYARLADAA